MNKIKPIVLFLMFVAVMCQHVAAEEKVVQIGGVELSAMNVADEAEIWDFSNRDVMGRMSLQYFSRGDSVVMELLPVVRCDYAAEDDSLRLMVAEGVSWRCQIDSAQQSGSLMQVKGTLSCNLSRKFDVRGCLSQKSSPGNTVILEPGDTIRSALLVEQTFEGIASELCVDDSVSHSLIASRRYWYAEGSQYPIAIELKCHFSSKCVGDYVYIFPLNEHPANQEQKNDQQERAFYNTTFESKTTYGAENNALSGTIPLESDKIIVSADNDCINVALPGEVDSADVILCDIQGRVLEAHKGAMLQTSFSNLRPGEYLISVSGADWRVTKKISIH